MAIRAGFCWWICKIQHPVIVHGIEHLGKYGSFNKIPRFFYQGFLLDNEMPQDLL